MIRRGTPHEAQSFDDAWTSGDRSRASTDVADLVRTAELLCRSAVAEPAADFRTDLRSRLMTEAATVLVANPTPARVAAPSAHAAPATRKHPMRRRLVGLTAATVAGIGSVGMISSSATAVPGDVLYPVKRGVESVQLSLHRGDTSRGEFQLSQARERLAEAWWLDSHGKDDRVADVLDTFSDQAAAGSDRLFTAYDGQSSAATIATVNDFAAAATVTLTSMSDDLPEDAQAALDAAADTVTGLVSQATSLCTSCAPADVSSLVGAVDQAAGTTPVAPAQSGDPAPADAQADRPTSTSNQGGGSDAPAPTGGGLPAVTPTKKTPALKDVTDPLIGGLLGDGQQEGLVPGLLDGLLGGGKK